MFGSHKDTSRTIEFLTIYSAILTAIIIAGILVTMVIKNEQGKEFDRITKEKAAAEAGLTAETARLKSIETSIETVNEETRAEFEKMTRDFETVPHWLAVVNFGMFPALPEFEDVGHEETNIGIFTKREQGLPLVYVTNTGNMTLKVSWPNIITAMIRQCAADDECPADNGNLYDLGVYFYANSGTPRDKALVRALVAVAENVVLVNQITYAFNEVPDKDLKDVLPKDKATKNINSAWNASKADLATPPADKWAPGNHGYEGFFRRRYGSNPALILVYKAGIALAAHKYGLENSGQMLAEAIADLEKTTTGLDQNQKQWLLDTLNFAATHPAK
ncbi:MAG: hypothetical protein V1664_00755 [Candidatus Uhrbacteria bacterium]